MDNLNTEKMPAHGCEDNTCGEEPRMGAGQCDRMCADCSKTCTRDWGHSGPHRCDTHARH